jgi:PAT family beta-lactamase induction signal transducer AmpG
MVVDELGWANFFLITVLIAVPGLVLLFWRRLDIQKLDWQG